MSTMAITISERELEALVERKVNALLAEPYYIQSIREWASANKFEPVEITKTEALKLKRARLNYAKGNYVTWYDLKNELDSKPI